VDLVHPRCAGIDISKRDAKVCVRIASSGRARANSSVTTWGAMTSQILCQRTAGIPRGRTAFLQVGGQQFSKWADSSSPSGRPRRRPLQLVLLGTGARSQIAGATTGCLSGDVLGHSCPPASPSSLSARR
jgi:hypothetical protein